MEERLNRNDIVEKRAKCVVCGYELTYPEYINDDKCVFHSEFATQWGFLGWIIFALTEYRVYRKKRAMAHSGLTAHDFQACVGLHAEDIGNLNDSKGMSALLKELSTYKVEKCQG